MTGRTICITGATGFVGSALCPRMLGEGWNVRGVVRSSSDAAPLAAGVTAVPVDGLSAETDWAAALSGIDVVVHLAARTHVTRERNADPLQAYRSVNVAGTERLARAAVRAGVKRFVFLSSIKVNGEGREEPYTERDVPAPEDAYGISKWEAEQVLHRAGRESGMEIVVLRPPLIYGAGVKANFLALLRIVEKGIPLPLAGVRNRRSFISVGNLVDLVARCCQRPEAAGKAYLVSDGEDVSTPELITRIAACFGRRARMFPFPAGALRLAGRFTGRSRSVDRLLGSLAVDASAARRDLAWEPPFSMAQGLQETVQWYLGRQGRER